MNEFHSVNPKDFDPIFSRIGNDWMLISASDGTKCNTMTASWGCCGILWNKPVAVCFIRPQRFTFPIAEKASHLSLSFLGEEYRASLTFCGKNSGRDYADKFGAAGLTCVQTENGVPYPAEAHTVLVCKKLYADDLKKEAFLDLAPLSNYAKGDYHRMYICEIEQILQK